MKTGEIADLLNGDLRGGREIVIRGAASLRAAADSEIAFVDNPGKTSLAEKTSASCLIAPMGFKGSPDCVLILVDDPKLAFARVAAVLHPAKLTEPGVHRTASIAAGVEIGADVSIAAFCFVGKGSRIGDRTKIRAGARVGDDVTIGADCVIHCNVVIEDSSEIGSGVVLKSGAVIGARGFGFVRGPEGLVKFPQIGRTVIEDDVEIGANTCIDRGALGETRIGAGTKIDNLVQVAHNVTIGKRTVIAAQTGISGSVEIGDDCVVAGQVGFADHTSIANGVVIGAKSAVFPGKKLKSGPWAGIPVRPLGEYKRRNAHIRSIPRIKAELKKLRSLVRGVEERLRGRDGKD